MKCRDRETWRECVNVDMKLLDLQPEWAIFRDMWMVEGLHIGQIAKCGRNGCFQNK